MHISQVDNLNVSIPEVDNLKDSQNTVLALVNEEGNERIPEILNEEYGKYLNKYPWLNILGVVGTGAINYLQIDLYRLQKTQKPILDEELGGTPELPVLTQYNGQEYYLNYITGMFTKSLDPYVTLIFLEDQPNAHLTFPGVRKSKPIPIKKGLVLTYENSFKWSPLLLVSKKLTHSDKLIKTIITTIGPMTQEELDKEQENLKN